MSLDIDLLGNIVGYIGMFGIVFAFLMMQFKKQKNMLVYNIINLFSSIFLLINLCIHVNIASLTLEIFWIFGSIYGIIMSLKKH